MCRLMIRVIFEDKGNFGEPLPPGICLMTIRTSLYELPTGYSYTRIFKLSAIDSELSLAFDEAFKLTRDSFKAAGIAPKEFDVPS
jgi:hypothetical protein